jgi:signal peptidase I
MKLLRIVQAQNKSVPNDTFAELMRAVLATGNTFRFSANGISMFPCIRNGDLITIAPITNKLQVGDIVAAQSNRNPLLVHRIIRNSPTGFSLKGDNSDAMDGMFPINSILGKVVEVERNHKSITLGVKFGNPIFSFLSKINLIVPIMQLVARLRSIM